MKQGVVVALSVLTGVVIGSGVVKKIEGNKFEKAFDKSKKHFELFRMMTQWVRIKQEGKNLSSYFEQRGYKKIAVYGMSYAGETLINELRDTGIEVAYGIDKNADNIFADIPTVSIEDSLEKVDAVVVTAITFFVEIEDMLCKKVDCPIISLEDVLYGV
ncbi:MAG: hypothetical protein NC489_15065 [Ruminococcus flavefaciens]|nr:hypothetical protein [Roseburia sp.]MCM1231438.1 hypothetical protein [Ruminococcus flavefaciens]